MRHLGVLLLQAAAHQVALTPLVEIHHLVLKPGFRNQGVLRWQHSPTVCCR
jgi:hypothetical protein